MTDKEFIEKALIDYNEALTCLQENETLTNFVEVLRYLEKKSLNRGICWYASKEHNLDLYVGTWVENYKSKENLLTSYEWWCHPPEHCSDVPEIIESLKYRISILTQHLMTLNP